MSPAVAPAAGPGARAVARDVLQLVLDGRRTLDSVMETMPEVARLAPRDRAFARLLAATVLRRLGQIDEVIDGMLDRPADLSHGRTRHALRLGAAQLLFLATPPHAAVSETVALAPQRHRGLVNAVLRRVAREGEARAARQDAARANTPGWLWDAWTAAYGEPTARAIAGIHLREPPLDITVRTAPEVWARRLKAAILPTGSLRRATAGPVTALPGYDDGAWWVQDAAAALPARLLGDVAGRRVIDLCAAPGGKTAQLAAAGAEVVAVDSSAERMRRLEANMRRLGLAVRTVVADARTWRPGRPAELVLLDAPCTATGTIRRHPDVARLKSPEDVARMVEVQDRLLDAAVEMTAPGGRLVYCACSLQPEEGPDRIAALLARGAPVRRRAVLPAEIGGLAECVTAEGDLRTLPAHLADAGGLDGFYAARLERT